MSRPPVDLDARAAGALTHPLRMAILWGLEDGPASPSELARRLDAPLEAVSYHVRKLHELGIIVADEPEVLEGSVRHPYRRVTKPVIGERAWDGLSAVERDMLTHAILTRAWRTARAALPRGGWQRVDSHISRNSLVLDVQGFEEVSAILVRATKEIEAAERRAAERLEHPTATRFDGTLVTLFFETPDVDVLAGVIEELSSFGNDPAGTVTSLAEVPHADDRG